MERVQFNYTLSSEAQQEKQAIGSDNLMKNAEYSRLDEALSANR